MQPEPDVSFPETSTDSAASEQHSRNHGISTHDDRATLPSAADVARGRGPAIGAANEQVAADAALASSLQERENQPPSPPPSGRLSIQSTPSPPSGRDRIAEYENASTPPARRRGAMGFEVIQKHRSPSDKRSPIQELPNEVLTHVLAHLAPSDLTSVAVTSKRFHDLVTGPHAWRSAFAHYFPGRHSINLAGIEPKDEAADATRSGQRAFTRLTALASWRSEYILRTRLLRSLARGKPVQVLASPNSARSGHAHTAQPVVAYNSQLFTTINHLHATFGTGLNKRFPRFIHGADEQGLATSSDPFAGKVDNWGLSDPQSFLQFAERFPGDAQYGLGPGDIAAAPNVMDVSQPYGMVHGEGSPGGMTYYRSTEEMRGRFLLVSSEMSVPNLGIPRISSAHEAITAAWIAKSTAIPSLSDGTVGLLTGSSLGVLTAYSLGSTNGGGSRERRFGRGEMTARWVLSPGVPLICIAVDNEYTINRYAQNRIWAVVLNALGEVFYMTKFPKRPSLDGNSKHDAEAIERAAWVTGRSVFWNLVECSRRTARPDPYADAMVDGSYSPRSSWNGMCLSKEQIQAETREIEAFVRRRPKEIQKLCKGWDMRRKLEVDFAGDDRNNAGESVVVFDCGLEEGDRVAVKRLSRCRFSERRSLDTGTPPPLTNTSTEPHDSPSLFGGAAPPLTAPVPDFSFERLEDSLSQDDFAGSATPRPMTEEWRMSSFSLGGLKNVQILATAVDNSIFASQTISEDPLLSFSARSNASSPILTPASLQEPVTSTLDIPGQRARLLAAGTKTGSVVIWNMRAPLPKLADSINSVEAVRIIHTASPQISCLALSSLYLVHGGNDGLVQAWDPLASDMQPIRTLHSRFSSRARRRLVQAQASPEGVGINLFAAGAICLDPDPSALRGIVSLGTQLRYWSYSSSAADQYKSHKRRLRRSERGSNNGANALSGTTRGNLKDYIANERHELERERQDRRKEAQKLATRFGTTLMDGSEEEMIAYAAMLSQESLEQEALRRSSDTSTAVSSSERSGAAMGSGLTPTGSASPYLSTPKTDDELDADVAEAIRLSLAGPGGADSAGFEIPIRQARAKGRKGSSARPSPKTSPGLAGASQTSAPTGLSDLDFALQLSLAEEQSRNSAGHEQPAREDFPGLAASGRGEGGKGKRRAS